MIRQDYKDKNSKYRAYVIDRRPGEKRDDFNTRVANEIQTISVRIVFFKLTKNSALITYKEETKT